MPVAGRGRTLPIGIALVWVLKAPPARSLPDAPPPEPAPEATQPNWWVPSLHATGIFVSLRTYEAFRYPDPFADPLSTWPEHYADAFTEPPLFDSSAPFARWDGDPWTINLIGHALLGSELYYRPRRCGSSVLPALAFTAGATLAWEYAFEANGVRPSAQDLVYTPLSGLIFGEARYLAWTAADGIGEPTLRVVLRTLLDPLGELERGLGTPC